MWVRRLIRSVIGLAAALIGVMAIGARVFTGELGTSPSSPLVDWYFAGFLFRTLEHWVAVGALGLAAVAVAVRARILAAGLAAYAVTILLSMVIARPSGASIAPEGPVWRVLSANLELGRSDTGRLIAEIERVRPDFVALQECTPARYAELVQLLSASFPFHAAAFRDDVFGQAVFSRQAFLGAPDAYPHGRLAENARRGWLVGLQDPQIRVAVSIAGREAVVQCVHLAPVVTSGTFVENRRQAAWLADWVSGETRGVVVVGDHNFTARSAQAAALRRAELVEAHEAVGRGVGATWPQKGPLKRLPGFRIDRVELGNGLVPVRAEVAGPIGSDHLPIVVDLAWGVEG